MLTFTIFNQNEISFFRARRKWNLLRYCTSVVSLGYSEYKTELNEEQNQRSFGDKLGDFLDKNQVNIQLLTIYAGLIGIVLEGNYSDYFSFYGYVAHRDSPIL